MESDNSSGESFPSNEHIDVSSTQQQQVVLVAGHNRWEWLLLSFSLINVISLTISSVISIRDCPKPLTLCESCLVLEVLICTVAGISLMFANYGIFFEHQYDIYLHSVWMIVAVFCSWVSFSLSSNNVEDLKLKMNIVSTIICLASFFLAFKATHVPDWIEYRLIGVSDPLAAMYKDLCYFLAVLKFDSIFVVTFAVFSADFSYHLNCSYWSAYQALIILYAVSMWQLGKMAVNKEDSFFVYAFYFANFCFPIFATYQLYELSYKLYLQPSGKADLVMCSASVAFGLCAIISKMYLMWRMRKTHLTFGYGLNLRSFRDLVSRNSNNLLSHTRSALLF